MRLSKEVLADYGRSGNLEWIETNGLGGYASATVSGANSRRYHGLLVASLHPPVERTVLLAKLEETLHLPSVDGSKPNEIALSTNQYPGTLHPSGYQYLSSFERTLFPVFTFDVGDVVLKKTVAAVNGENTTLVLYEVEKARGEFVLSLLPLYSARDFHSLSHANEAIGKHYLFDDGVFRTLNYQGGSELFISVPGATFTEQQGWYYNVEYAVEQYRGLDFREDLYTHGSFQVSLKQGDKLGIIVSTESPEGKDAFELFGLEQQRRERLTHGFSWDDNIRQLALAADQFIVKRDQLKTIVAGYHWFADWGRDTMISLPGLCLATDRYDEAKHILQQFANSVSDGMLPNRFPDYGEAPEYNTIDATLWLFHAMHRYYHYSGDGDFILDMYPVLESIVEWHIQGTRFGIRVDAEDGLLQGGQEGVQLTWMDAKVGDWVVTPRRGKAVEINALWYNALCSMEYFSDVIGNTKEAARYSALADRVLKSFNKHFWNKADECLYDVIDGDDKHAEIRPNQLYAISLPFRLLSKDKSQKVLSAVEQHLLTPRGLRSLSPGSPSYQGHYGGGVWQRDGAYHQGTVWSFLLGPYVDAVMHVKGEKKGREEATKVIRRFLDHLGEGCVGTVSEIFDAEPPFAPRGCVAQAWGVAEVLRVILEHGLLGAVDRKKPSISSVAL